jgi:hypothetical protein
VSDVQRDRLSIFRVSMTTIENLTAMTSSSEDVPLAAYAGIQILAQRPHTQDPDSVDVAELGVPFDTGVTFRAGGRTASAAVRKASAMAGHAIPPSGWRHRRAVLFSAAATRNSPPTLH